MRHLRLILITSLALCLSVPSWGQILRNKELVNENAALRGKIDSLLQVIDSYQIDENEIKDDDDKFEANPIFDDNVGLDSLMSIWYMHRQLNQYDYTLDPDMDSQRFTSDVPDSTMIRRLKDMNAYITLPYNSTVRNYMIQYSEKSKAKMARLLGLSQYYMPIFEETFNRYGMPEELKMLAIIESALNPRAVSRAGAKGMWQFMYSTGKMYGLRINSFVDERFDPYKSADAAARYLRDAYSVFGDWSLAISSYNCGSGNVNKAIKRAGSRDFWSVYNYLPRETRGYMPAFVGALYGFTYYKEYGIKPDKCMMPAETDTFEIHKNLHFKQISEMIGIPVETLRELNPQYIHDIIPGQSGNYTLRLPYNYTGSFIEKEDTIYHHKEEELIGPKVIEDIASGRVKGGNGVTENVYYKVKKGDNLGKIASKNGVTVQQLKKWNNIKSNNIRIGQRLIVRQKTVVPKSTPIVDTSKANAPDSSKTKGTIDNTAAQTPANKMTETSATAEKAIVSSENEDKTAEYFEDGGPSDDKTVETSVKSETNKETKPVEKSQIIHKVVKGDNLFKISKKYGVSVDEIREANNIEGSNIKIGQKLKIPQK